MTDTATNLSDTSTWLPLDGLAPGFDANKAPHSLDLVGREVAVVDERGTRIVHRFNEHTVDWEYQPGAGDPTEAAAKTDAYEAVKVDEELYYVQFHHEYLPNEAVTLVLDFRSGHALAVISVILPEPEAGKTRVQQIFVPSQIEGIELTGDAPAPTTTLIGRRVQWVYSPVHAYEHIYLSPQWYTWQCLAGPERGLADTDENSVWQIRPGIYVFAWREKVIPCASVTIADHRDARAIRSHGVLFGLDESGEVPTHFTFGAHGRLISVTVHPDEYDTSR
ncbi:molybdenum cofactor biosynthesis F family protein [Agromyces mediolanus]|uniref:molybdenum cofactor biosynthesis F family protein n=1 Tax=Agromyces mediolanus TaxID=41986 RepID=UPI001E2A83A9|nr:molybdenum cofactor biosynthesis F family protein [Agromyces mediolanus]MCD1571994.1 molybdenum cofactor biosynthesis F family protein [Agromyces mediolanus]